VRDAGKQERMEAMRATRREFLGLAVQAMAPVALMGWDVVRAQAAAADYTIEIAETSWEIAPKKAVRTAAYGGRVPGPMLRVKEGRPVAIEIVNKLDRPEIVHWHGQWIPSDVDGSMEEGSPMLPAGNKTVVRFTPKPSGLHWYHTHTAAGRDFRKGLYSGQFGVLYVEPKEDAGAHDREEFVVLHEWEPYFVSSDDGAQEVEYKYGTVNGRMLGAGEPLRVKQGERVLLHVLNASATVTHWLALPGHLFQVMALDGRPVPTQARVPFLRLGPAERVSAVVEMNQPGVWVLGEMDAKLRAAGMGIVVEYAGQNGAAKWTDSTAAQAWSYATFGDASVRDDKPDVTIPLVFTSKFQGHGALNRWMINGKSFPEHQTLTFTQGLRHRLFFENRSMDDHPVHLHRHVYELKFINSVATSGVLKDVMVVPANTRVGVDVVASNPGPTLFHCHQQDHMDLGFMALFQYA
jgi:FtsP/CotA-like multicopper oxidase with cupredoxin domain